MIADISITEKSFGPKVLMTGVKFSVDDGEKVGLVGRNGIGKSTLFGMLAGTDTDYTGTITYRRGTTVVATAQEHHAAADVTVMDYILAGLPEYTQLHRIMTTYPETMGDDMQKLDEYSEALERFGQKGYYQVEEMVAEELKHFQMPGVESRPLASLSGGQKRLVEVVKIMHSQAHLALIDEPTNHMDYVAKKQFIDWMERAPEAMIVITHDRDVLARVDRIVELRDGEAVSYKGNYDAYLRQNAHSTGTAMTEFEHVEKRMANLRDKVLHYQRLKEKARNPSTIANFKRLENQSRDELAELEKKEKPTFWIDKQSVETLNYKVAANYDKYKARNIRLGLRTSASRSKHVLVSAKDLALGYGDNLLFEGVNIDLREGEAVELRGRNGAGKTTLIRALLTDASKRMVPVGDPLKKRVSESFLGEDRRQDPRPATYVENPMDFRTTGAANEEILRRADLDSSRIVIFDGSLTLDPHVRVGIYEQEVSPDLFDTTLYDAIERTYLSRNLAISDTKIRKLLNDYLFTESDGGIHVGKLSGGQKARLQIIAMLANDPQLLILDEPTNHLDLPSIEELETALEKYAGAILYVSHDGYFCDAIGGDVVHIGAK